MTSTIDISNVGPIAQLTIPVAPGVVVLRGRNGFGKSTALESAAKLAQGEGKLEARYGTPAGSVEGFGATLTVSASRTRGTGELLVSHLAGASIGSFVDPGIQDPERADAARIAELCGLVGAKASMQRFAEALGVSVESLKAAASMKTVQETSVPDMAAGLRRDLQAAAREHERAEATARGAAQALLAASAGPGGDTELSEAQAQAVLADAIRTHARLQESARQAAASFERSVNARRMLDEARTSYSGPTAQEAEAELERLDAECSKLRSALERLVAARSDADTRHMLAKQHEENCAAWEASLAAGENVATVTVADIDNAASAVQKAREGLALATLARDRAEKRAQAELKLAEADHKLQTAQALRDAADATEGVISAEIARVAPAGLKVHHGRLVLEANGKTELFAKLSHGERWRIALDIALDSIPERDGQQKLLVVEQEAWEGLDPINRKLIHEHAKARGAIVLTAECDAGELRAEPM